MIKQYFTQAWAQLRQQPLMSAVGIAGTALAIFLIMLVVMMQQVKVAPFAPESNRDRFLHVKSMSISNSNWGEGTSNGPMSVQTARECFQSLKTPEAVTIYTIFPVSTPVSLPGKPAVSGRRTTSSGVCLTSPLSMESPTIKPYSTPDNRRPYLRKV